MSAFQPRGLLPEVRPVPRPRPMAAGTRRGPCQDGSASLQQSLATLGRAVAVEHEHDRPALTDRALHVATDAGELRLGERERLHVACSLTARRSGPAWESRLAQPLGQASDRRRRGRGSGCRRRDVRRAGSQARARQRLAVDTVAVGIDCVGGALRGGLVGEVRADRARRGRRTVAQRVAAGRRGRDSSDNISKAIRIRIGTPP